MNLSAQSGAQENADGRKEIRDEAFLDLLSVSQIQPYREGEMVVLGGSDARSVFYVEKGAVEISYTVQGTRIVVALLGEGNFFGEIGFFDGISRVRDIRVTEDSVLRILRYETLEKIQENNPLQYGKILSFMARSICAKFRRVLEEREPLTAYAASLSTGKRLFQSPKPLPEEFFRTREWQAVSGMVENFKASFYDLSYQLQLDPGTEIDEKHYGRCAEILDEFNEQLRESASLAGGSDLEDYVWGFAFKEIFPYFMRSRFAERAYFKPKGYAGDFLMIEMLYQNRPDGDGKLGKLVDRWCLDTATARAVRGRRALLSSLLKRFCGGFRETNERIHVMNLACGSNRELFDFLSECDYSEAIDITAVDADVEALEYTNRVVNIHPHRASIRLVTDNIVKWSLGRARQNFGQQHVIYSSGLTDYLDTRLFRALVNRCYEHLHPGGVLIIGNFGPNNPHRMFMDHIILWKLIHRSGEELREIFAGTAFGDNVEIAAEEQTINLFAIARKSG